LRVKEKAKKKWEQLASRLAAPCVLVLKYSYAKEMILTLRFEL